MRYFTDRTAHGVHESKSLAYFFSVVELDDDGNEVYMCSEYDFKLNCRVTRRQLTELSELLKDDPVFNPRRKRRAARPVQQQLFVALYRFGAFGNLSGVRQVASRFDLGGMTVLPCFLVLCI